MFSIPAAIQDIFNKLFGKEESLYTREETPHRTDLVYGERVYRGVSIPTIEKITLQYDSSIGTEIYTAVRDANGVLLGTRKTMHRETPDNIA